MNNNWTFFQDLTTQLLALVQAAGTAIENSTDGYVNTLIMISLTAWIAFRGVCAAYGKITLGTLMHDIVRGAVIVFLLQIANYDQYVGNVATAIPLEVGNALSAAGMNNANVVTGAAFDNVFSVAVKAGLLTWDHIPRFSFSSIPLWFGVMAYIVVAIFAIGIAYLVYMASLIMMILLIKTGPLFVFLFAFEVTTKFGAGWVAALVTTILAQIFTMAILVFFVGTEQATIVKITANLGGGTDNFINDIVTLLEAAFLLFMIGNLVRHSPGLASTIGGGVYQGVGGLIDKATGSATGAAKGTVGGIATAARGVSTGTRTATATVVRMSKPTGRSKSRG